MNPLLRFAKMPRRIVVDGLMLEKIKAAFPVARGELGVIYGATVERNDAIGAERGLIFFADGTIEKFGNWPTHQKEKENGTNED